MSGSPTNSEWRQLTGPALVEAMISARWYVQPNDVIGGWCIMPVDEPPSEGVPEVATFLAQDVAERIVKLHNAARRMDEVVRRNVPLEVDDDNEVMAIELSPATKFVIRDGARNLHISPNEIVLYAVLNFYGTLSFKPSRYDDQPAT